MTALVLRTTQGSALSIAQMDGNLTALNGNAAGLINISTATSLLGGTGVTSPNNLGEVVEIIAAVAITMPVANTAANGSTIKFVSTVNGATVTRAGTDTFYVGPSSINTFTLNSGDTLTLVSNGSNGWVATSGSVILPYASEMNGANWTTPAQFDNTSRFATTAFVKGAGLQFPVAGGTAIAANVTLTLAQLNNWFQFQSGTAIATLPAIASAQIGATYTFQGGSTGGTVKGNASENIISSSGSSANTLAIAIGETVTIAVGSTGWYVVADGLNSVATNTMVNGGQSISLGTGGTTTLTAAQSAAQIMIFTGALTSNATVVVPTAFKTFVVENNTTGAYTVTIKTAAGTGILVNQGKTQELICDGTNVALATSDLTGMGIYGNVQVSYANRGNLRTIEGPANATITVESLGEFTWNSGFNDVDDDETCFLSATGTWLLVATDPDWVWSNMYPELMDYMVTTFNQTVSLITTGAIYQYNFAVPGVNIGDIVLASASPSTLFTGIIGGTATGSSYASVNAWVSSPNTVTINFTNQSAANVSVITGTWTVLVIKKG